MQKEVVRAYRSLLRGAFKVFHNDPRMKLGARMGAKDAFVANAGETDPEKIAEMIKVAYDARDYMFHELVQVEFDAKKGKHVATLEERHLKDNESGEFVVRPRD